MMKMNQNADWYRARIEAVDDYVIMADQPDWKIMLAILGLPIPAKRELETPDFMTEVG